MKRLALSFLLLAACTRSAPPIDREAQVTSASVPSASSAGASAATSDAGAAGALRIIEASEDSDALSLIRTERLKAKADGRVLVVYAGAKWCEPCRRFKDAAHSGQLDSSLSKTTILAFDADRDTERLAAAGYRFSFIPYVGLPGADGHPAESNEASGKGSESWRALLGSLGDWQSRGAIPK